MARSKSLVPAVNGRAVTADHERPARSGGYLRDTRTGIIATRPAYLRESRDDIRVAWRRAAALSLDLIHNSGRLKGAVDQVLADTVGVELILNPQPDLSGLGFSDQEATEWIRLVKKEWKFWAWNPRECDLRGKFTFPQLVDIALRWDIAYGEVTGAFEYMRRAERKRYGIKTGTKLCLIPPTRLVQETNEFSGLVQGVFHDANGRPTHYRFNERLDGVWRTRDYASRDGAGRPQVLHVFDPVDATDVRGISKLVAGLRRHIQHETLQDSTLQQAILQTVLAVVLTSPEPSSQAFEALEQLKDMNTGESTELFNDFLGYFGGALDRAKDGKISFSGDPQVSHLAPGESLELKSVSAPGPNYQPFEASLSRDTARAIGITYGGLTMDHTDATYSSVRMENSSIWPVVMRRRERCAAPICQAGYENWLDEAIGEGRIPFKAGYEAFAANRDRVCWAQWQGPAKPSADDFKSARASSERLENGTSSIEIETADLGHDADEVFEQRERMHKRYTEAGMRSPYEPIAGLDRSDPSPPKQPQKEGS